MGDRLFLDICYSLLLIAVAPLLLLRSLRTGKYRDHVGERLGKLPRRTGAGGCIWLHAVSLGEMRATRTLVPALAAARPNCEIVLSTNTETGRAEAAKLYPGRRVFYYPLDFTGCVAAALDAIRPSCVVLMELEFWPNFTAECARRGIPIVLVNGRLTERSARGYRRAGRVVADMFNRAARLCVQTDAYAGRVRSLGVKPEKIVVVPNLKYDTADTSELPDLRSFAAEIGLAEGDELLVAGSTGPGEEETLLAAYREILARRPKLRLALVPRHPQRFEEVAAKIAALGFPLVRRSGKPTAANEDSREPRVILGDTMGELRKFYGLCRVAFLGRSLIPAGGSDMAEAAGLGKPTVFGPHVENFEDTVDCLLSADSAIRVGSAAELRAVFERLLSNPAAAEEMGLRAAAALKARRGGTERSVREIAAAMAAAER